MDEMSITVPCPECRKSTLKSLVELEGSDKVICPFCGGVTDLTKEYWRTAIRNARQIAEQIKPKQPR
jgi:hypothetical protein